MDSSKQAVLRRAKTVQAYQAVFSGPVGREVLADLVRAHRVLQPVYVKGDMNEMLIREGERNVVLRILTTLDMDLTHVLKLIEGDGNVPQQTHAND